MIEDKDCLAFDSETQLVFESTRAHKAAQG